MNNELNKQPSHEASKAVLTDEMAALRQQLVNISVKHEVACSTLEIVKEQRTVAQRALAEQCKETKRLRDEIALLRAATLEEENYPSITLNGYQLSEAMEFLAPDRAEDQMKAEITIANLPAEKAPLDDDEKRMPAGIYAWFTDYPEEGCIPLRDEPQPEAIRSLSGQGQASKAAQDVLAERQRQMSVEGWTPEHDDEHCGGEMAEAAACYITGMMEWSYSDKHQRWPWAHAWWKPKGRRRDLVRAAALLLAEIERIDRAAAPGAQQKEGTL